MLSGKLGKGAVVALFFFRLACTAFILAFMIFGVLFVFSNFHTASAVFLWFLGGGGLLVGLSFICKVWEKED